MFLLWYDVGKPRCKQESEIHFRTFISAASGWIGVDSTNDECCGLANVAFCVEDICWEDLWLSCTFMALLVVVAFRASDLVVVNGLQWKTVHRESQVLGSRCDGTKLFAFFLSVSVKIVLPHVALMQEIVARVLHFSAQLVFSLLLCSLILPTVHVGTLLVSLCASSYSSEVSPSSWLIVRRTDPVRQAIIAFLYSFTIIPIYVMIILYQRYPIVSWDRWQSRESSPKQGTT